MIVWFLRRNKIIIIYNFNNLCRMKKDNIFFIEIIVTNRTIIILNLLCNCVFSSTRSLNGTIFWLDSISPWYRYRTLFWNAFSLNFALIKCHVIWFKCKSQLVHYVSVCLCDVHVWSNIQSDYRRIPL